MQIDVYADVVCPWCAIGIAHLKQALSTLPDQQDVTVRVRSYQLDPDAPLEPRLLADVLGARYGAEAFVGMMRTVAERGREAGVVIDLDPATSVTGNTAAAHALLQSAWDAGVQPAVADALYRAHFAAGRSVFGEDSLRRIAAEAGMPQPAIEAAFTDPSYARRVAQDAQRARELGITGVPFFVIDDQYGVSGAQPPQVLRQVLQQVRDAA